MANFSIQAGTVSTQIGYWEGFTGDISASPVYQQTVIERLTYSSAGNGELTMYEVGLPLTQVISVKINGIPQEITYSFVEPSYAEYNLANPGGTNPFVDGEIYNIEMLFTGEALPPESGTATQGIKDLFGQFEYSKTPVHNELEIVDRDFFKPVIVTTTSIYLGASSLQVKYKGSRLLTQLYRGTRLTS